MADETGISWTDHTHNEWWGCSSTAGAGCDNCYAATLDKRTQGASAGKRMDVPARTLIKNIY